MVGSRAPVGPERPPASIARILAGRAVIGGRLQPVEVALGDDGSILSIGKVRRGAPRHDVGEAILLPAATDLHVHFREPGGSARVEDLASGTRQAILGGVALVGEMPNTVPPVDDVERLEEKARRIPGRAATDVLLYAGVGQPSALRRLAARAGAFKVFLSPTTGVDEPPAADVLPGLLRTLADLGLPVGVHAEDPMEFVADPSPRSPAEWNRARPVRAELAAVARLVPPPSGLRLHVAHVTSAAVVDRLRTAGVSFEATPHHLLLSDRSRPDAFGKVNPPLRDEGTRRALWEAFARGDIPILASDHAPHARAAKEQPFAEAPSGMPGTETMLPLLLARVRDGTLPLATLLQAACDRPARWLGRPHGRLAPGHRAHLLVVDFRRRVPISADRLHAPAGWSAFEGLPAIFPREVYFNGERVVQDGEYVGRPTGRVVRPEFAPGPGR